MRTGRGGRGGKGAACAGAGPARVHPRAASRARGGAAGLALLGPGPGRGGRVGGHRDPDDPGLRRNQVVLTSESAPESPHFDDVTAEVDGTTRISGRLGPAGRPEAAGSLTIRDSDKVKST